MEHLTTTPFGRRPVTAGLIRNIEAARAAATLASIDKWKLFRALCTAKVAFGVRDRDLTVLNALLSFHQDNALTDNASLIVFPSNAALSDRAHGMAESTLRRHLAVLVNAGLILRHDSPNGKRYVRRDGEGAVLRAFGFDLRPLLVQAPDILSAATQAKDEERRLQAMREEAVLLKRDVAKLIELGEERAMPGNWDALSDRCRLLERGFRRKLQEEDLRALKTAFETLLETVWDHLKTEEMSGNDASSERHIQNSKPDSQESELPEKKEGQGADVVAHPQKDEATETGGGEVKLPLYLVLKACPDISDYATEGIRHWDDLVRLAQDVRAMMGISEDAWQHACRSMGPQTAAVTVACILQKFASIRSHGGYLRALSQKAEEGGFSPGPMVMALLNGQRAAA